MLSFNELNKVWAKTVRSHATTPLMGVDGSFRPIGDKTLVLLDPLWKANLSSNPDVGALIASGKRVKFWADPHFDHDKIRTLCGRTDFLSLDHMNQSLWNAVMEEAKDCDLMICVGDLALDGAIGWQRKLIQNLAQKHCMLVGNHDLKGSKPQDWVNTGASASLAFSLPLLVLKQWTLEDEPEAAAQLDWSSLPAHIHFGVAHWPLPVDRLPSGSWISIHGHLHHKSAGPLKINCSVERIGYRPKTLREMWSSHYLKDLIARKRNPKVFDGQDLLDPKGNEL